MKAKTTTKTAPSHFSHTHKKRMGSFYLAGKNNTLNSSYTTIHIECPYDTVTPVPS